MQNFSLKSSENAAEVVAKFSNEKLYELCQQYGERARFWRQKFIGLLPEVNRRRLFEEKGFSSIFEFAAKLCGLSAEQVRLTLNLDKRFEDKPILKNMLENGEASINKLTRVVSIATPENEEELAEKIKILPISALNTLVRDEKHNGSLKPLFGAKGLYVQTFELADDVAGELNELVAKGIDVNELLRAMLKRRRDEIAAKKAHTSAEIEPAKSGYVPVETQKLLKEEYGEKCSIETCAKRAQVIHHEQRFALAKTHNPKYLAPLCADHHVIAHSIDQKYHEARAKTLKQEW